MFGCQVIGGGDVGGVGVVVVVVCCCCQSYERLSVKCLVPDVLHRTSRANTVMNQLSNVKCESAKCYSVAKTT